MDRSDVASLLREEIWQDENGIERTTITGREVFCQVDSVTASEFFDGGRSGLNPEYRFTVFAGDYEGERMLRYGGCTYSIYRTYRARTDIIELYAERKGGTNGKADTG